MVAETPPLDRNSGLPLYVQLKRVLQERIENGEWLPGVLLPSEQELQEAYSLSRTTVRQALAELVFEGHLSRHRGRGTFIAEHQPESNPSVRLRMKEVGDEPEGVLSWRVLDHGWKNAKELSSQVVTALKVPNNGRAYVIRRLRLIDGRPMGYHFAYLNSAVYMKVNLSLLDRGESLDYIQAETRLLKARVHRIIEAVAADKYDMEWLDLASGTPVLQLERLIIAEDGTPLEFVQAHCRGDRFKYQITI